MMNKLLVVEDKKIDSGEYYLEIKENVLLSIKGNAIIHDIKSNNNEIHIKIENDSSLELYQVKKITEDYNIKITLLNNSKLKFYMLILNEGKHKVNINVDMLLNNALASIDVRAINIMDGSNLDIVCNGYVKKDTVNNELIENLKGLITKEDDTIKISPIMFIDTNEVTANHLVTVGSFNLDELFYLKSLGLNDEIAKKMLIEAFLKHKMTSAELEFLKLGGDNFE